MGGVLGKEAQYNTYTTLASYPGCVGGEEMFSLLPCGLGVRLILHLIMYYFYHPQSAPMIQYLERKLYKLVRLPPHLPDNTTIVFIHSFPTQGCLQDSLSGSDGGRLAGPCSGST